MSKHLLFGAITFLAVASTVAAASDPPPPPATEADHYFACQIYGEDDFTHFNLTSLDKPGKDSYHKDGVEWKFCDHLSGTRYFASIINDLQKGSQFATGE